MDTKDKSLPLLPPDIQSIQKIAPSSYGYSSMMYFLASSVIILGERGEARGNVKSFMKKMKNFALGDIE